MSMLGEKEVAAVSVDEGDEPVITRPCYICHDLKLSRAYMTMPEYKRHLLDWWVDCIT